MPSLRLDRDFPEILARTQASGPSVILFRMSGLRAERLVAILEKLEVQFGQNLLEGAVLSVREHAVRVRLLPIGT